MLPAKTPPRVRIEEVWPAVDAGRSPICRVPGDMVEVYADVFAEAAEPVLAALLWRSVGEKEWHSLPMSSVGNDRFHASFEAPAPGTFSYTVQGWTDPLLTWLSRLERRVTAGAVRSVDLLEGIAILRRTKAPPGSRAKEAFQNTARDLAMEGLPPLERGRAVLSLGLPSLLQELPPAGPSTIYRPELPLRVDPARAGHSSWYELFPRSASSEAGRPGSFRDVLERLPYIAKLGFDVLYLPPVHPIGRTGRKGRNNSEHAEKDAPGSPWAIGAEEGGHEAIHPELGTMADLRRLQARARELGIEVALDLAFQCSPDHPWVSAHPSWFERLPDGTLRTAENPPKRYQDVLPLDFSSKDWRALWEALKGVVDFWVDQGVRWFRVDNPHTKPFAFWEWLIAEVRREHPDVLFLAEAFTRPKVMYALAKVGFTHSYTYFTWRTTKAELTEYFRDLSEGPVSEFFRPHLWPNTPDILPHHLQTGGAHMFETRLLLAATLSSHYGIYGPAFERSWHEPASAGAEEYLNSEKYERTVWSKDPEGRLPTLIERVNRIRREHPALTRGRRLTFHGVDNEHLLAFSRRTEDRSSQVLCLVNLDPAHLQGGWTDLDLGELGIGGSEPFEVEDLLHGVRYTWKGSRNFVELRPEGPIGHLLRVYPGVALAPSSAHAATSAPTASPGEAPAEEVSRA